MPRHHVPTSVLVLDDATIRQILTMEVVIRLVERAFVADARGQVTTFPVIGRAIPGKDASWAVKSGHLELVAGVSDSIDHEVLGLKAGAYWPRNADRGLSNHNAAMMLIDPDTGRLSALMAANAITTMRTAAGGAVAARHLARKDAKCVAVLGAGDQAHAQLEALLTVELVKEVRVWARRSDRAQAYADFWVNKELRARAYASIQECVECADIVVTTTPSRTPLVESSWIVSGTHINAIGSDAPGKQELQAELVARAVLIADKRVQSLRIGEMQEPIARGLVSDTHVRAELGEVCAGLKPGRKTEDEITIFDSSGVSFQDLVVAGHLQQIAADRRLGNTIML